MWFIKDKNPLPTKWKIFFFVAGVTPVVVMFLYSLTLPSARQEFMRDSFTGLLIDKYFDTHNHNLRTFIIKKTLDEKPTDLVLVDDTLFYSVSRKGDSLVKVKGGLFFKICRPDTELVVPVDFRQD